MDGVSFKLIVGEAFGYKSPVAVFSPLYLIEIKSTKAAKLNIGEQLFGESALYILEGNIQSDANTYEPKQILVANNSKLCEYEIGENSTIYIFGGEPFPEERFIHWNFVSSDKAIIEQAKQAWLEQKFPKVPGEIGFVPLPQ
jgi:redox-sensitive bicupin YhaK (pirin superfamily)